MSRAEERRALVQLAKYMALIWVGSAVIFHAWSLRVGPTFDDRSPGGWVKGITTGEPGERAAVLVALSESVMLPRISCRVLVARLAETTVVREAAVFTLIKSLRAGRCTDVVLNALAYGSAATREAAAWILTGAGPVVRSSAIGPLVRTLESDSAVRGAAATALAAIGDTTDSVRHALERALKMSDGSARSDVLNALAELFPPRRGVPPTRSRAPRD